MGNSVVDKGKPNPCQGTPSAASSERLESWKEIAAFLRRDVRTVQRWEKNEALPVHRHLHDKLGSIYANKSELEAWRRERSPSPTPKPPQETGKTMLVVLPLEDLSGDGGQDFFSEGMTEELRARLAQLQPKRLGVIARTTSIVIAARHLRASQVGRELNVQYVVEGSVRRTGQRVRVTAGLIQVSDETHVWTDSYEGDIRDVFALWSGVAQAIARQIQIQLSPQEQALLERSRTVHGGAYDAYLNGRFYWNKRTPGDLQKAVGYFEEAIKEDPNYAPAYAGLADTYSLLASIPYDVLPPGEAMPKAKAAANHALKLDDTLADGHVALAYVLLTYDWNWPGAEREFGRALQLDPSYATAHRFYALYLTAMGQLDQAITEVKEARKLDPYSPAVNAALGQAYGFARRDELVVEQCQTTLEKFPGFYLAHYWLGCAYDRKGMHKRAIAEFERGRAVSEGSTLMIAALGHSYAVAGMRSQALNALKDLIALSRKRYVPALYMARIYSGLGDRDQAFLWLEKAYNDRSDYLVYLQRDPISDPFRADPRFQGLMRRIGLPP